MTPSSNTRQQRLSKPRAWNDATAEDFKAAEEGMIAESDLDRPHTTKDVDEAVEFIRTASESRSFDQAVRTETVTNTQGAMAPRPTG